MATTKATTLAHTLGGISSDISTAEINRLDNLTGDIQTQLDAKAPLASPTFTGTANISSGATFPSNPTLSLGSNTTLGDAVTHSVGWQHIGTKVGSTSSNAIDFSGIFTDTYVAFMFELALEANGSSEHDIFIRLLNASNAEIDDTEYQTTQRYFGTASDTNYSHRQENQKQGRLIYGAWTNSAYGGTRGNLLVRNVSAPTLAGVDTDRGAYRHDLLFNGTGYVENGYSHISNYIRFNSQRQEADTMGIVFYAKEHDTHNNSNAGTSLNWASGSWITCFGLKGKST